MAILGIVGGIAPGSTIDYYRLIIERYRQARPASGYPSLVINSIDLTHLFRLVESTDRESLITFLHGEVERLVQAGAELALLASNTPHLVFDEVAARASIPLLSIVEATARAAKVLGLKCLGLIGTQFTMEGGFYQAVFERVGIRVMTPIDSDRSWMHRMYLGELINGQFREESRRRMMNVITQLRENAGIDGVILGGTELPLLLRGENPEGVQLLDTTSIHVDEALAQLLERE